MLATLRCYLKHQCDLTRTAKQLWVHHNTVSYRLRRVEKLLDIELSNPRELLELQLALMILAVIQD